MPTEPLSVFQAFNTVFLCLGARFAQTARGRGFLDNGLFISLLNPAIALTLASAFFVLWLYQRQRRYLLVLVAAYVGSAAGFLLQYFTLPIGLRLTKLLSNTFFHLRRLMPGRRDRGALRTADPVDGLRASSASAGSAPSPGSCSSIPTSLGAFW